MYNFRNNPNIKKHLGIIELALATVQTLEHSHKNTDDKLLATEKGLLQTFEDVNQVFAQLTKTLNKESEKPTDQR